MDQDSTVVVEESEFLPGEGLDAVKESAREAEAVLSLKMSNKVRVQRWPGPLGPGGGQSLIILDLNKVSEARARSGFMMPWIIEKVREHLKGGGVFTNRGQTVHDDEEALVPNGQALYMQVRSEYRLATEQEVLDYVDHAQFANITGHRVSARAQEKGYILHYHEGVPLIEAYDKLPRQAKVILDLLNDTGRENFTEASIEVILTEHIDDLKTRQEPMKLWGFYRHRFVDDGHVEEVGED